MNLQVSSALATVNNLIPLLDDAERQFKSARNWSMLDIFGGGTFTDLVKHYKLSKASNIMNEVNLLLQRLNSELGNINIPDDYRMQMNGFLTFADFLFDGFIVDAYMASKIFSSIDEIQRLKNRLYTLRGQLQTMA